ncbi:MAG: GFA family protein [Nannocystaceae bacterium]
MSAPETTHTGGCHCGAVRYTVRAAIDSVIECNCSICAKTGSLLAFVPAAQFTLDAGAEATTDYQFNRKVIHHLFCHTCGIRSYAWGHAPDGSKSVAINVRCLDDLDVSGLAVQHFDGASM